MKTKQVLNIFIILLQPSQPSSSRCVFSLFGFSFPVSLPQPQQAVTPFTSCLFPCPKPSLGLASISQDQLTCSCFIFLPSQCTLLSGRDKTSVVAIFLSLAPCLPSTINVYKRNTEKNEYFSEILLQHGQTELITL